MSYVEPHVALMHRWNVDATLKGLTVPMEDGKAGFFPNWPEQGLKDSAYPRVTTPGVTGSDFVSPQVGDFEVSFWIHVPTSLDDPDATLVAIEQRMLALAHLQAWKHGSSEIRIYARCVGSRDAHETKMLRRRTIWAVGVN